MDAALRVVAAKSDTVMALQYARSEATQMPFDPLHWPLFTEQYAGWRAYVRHYGLTD